MSADSFYWVECPRDAMQGWPHPIPAAQKIRYLNALLRVGFDVLDAGSFVSPKAIPQMADTAEVLAALDSGSATKLLVIVANMRGAEEAVKWDRISYLGFPFSISETFQQRNTGKSIAESLEEVARMQALCTAHGKELVIYISMGFGNPYGDPYSPEVAMDWVEQLAALGIKIFAMSDTVGVAQPDGIREIFSTLIPRFPDCVIGAHFHSTISTWQEKMDAAWEGGCRRFDSAMKGIGGCPMAKDDLVGNMATENILHWAAAKELLNEQIDKAAFNDAMFIASEIFQK